MSETNTVDKTKDSFYQLFVSSTGAPSSFKKLERLLKCGVPSEAKTLDDITGTDDRRQINAVVDFKENSEIELEYVLLPDDTVHQLMQTAFDNGDELYFQMRFVEVPTESRQFKGIIAELTTDAEDTKKKLRKKGKIVLTADSTKELTE